MISYLGILLAFLAIAHALTTAPSGALVVGTNSTSYTTVQAAVDALDTSSSDEQVIFIQAGTYKEQVYIKALTGPLTIYGYSEDDSIYASNQATITYSDALANEDTDDETATLRVWTSDFKMYNVDVKNTYGQSNDDGQALALSASAEVSLLHSRIPVHHATQRGIPKRTLSD